MKTNYYIYIFSNLIFIIKRIFILKLQKKINQRPIYTIYDYSRFLIKLKQIIKKIILKSKYNHHN